MIDADVLVLASPVYFYSIDAQLKALIDRTVSRWLEVKDKEFYYIMTAADGETSSMEKLKTDYLDLCLLHQPFNDVYGAYKAMEDLYKEGRIRAIGISNFYVDRINQE